MAATAPLLKNLEQHVTSPVSTACTVAAICAPGGSWLSANAQMHKMAATAPLSSEPGVSCHQPRISTACTVAAICAQKGSWLSANAQMHKMAATAPLLLNLEQHVTSPV